MVAATVAPGIRASTSSLAEVGSLFDAMEQLGLDASGMQAMGWSAPASRLPSVAVAAHARLSNSIASTGIEPETWVDTSVWTRNMLSSTGNWDTFAATQTGRDLLTFCSALVTSMGPSEIANAVASSLHAAANTSSSDVMASAAHCIGRFEASQLGVLEQYGSRLGASYMPKPGGLAALLSQNASGIATR